MIINQVEQQKRINSLNNSDIGCHPNSDGTVWDVYNFDSKRNYTVHYYKRYKSYDCDCIDFHRIQEKGLNCDCKHILAVKRYKSLKPEIIDLDKLFKRMCCLN